VAPLIEGEHVEPIGERSGDAIEPVRVGGAPVQQAEAGSPGLPPLEAV